MKRAVLSSLISAKPRPRIPPDQRCRRLSAPRSPGRARKYEPDDSVAALRKTFLADPPQWWDNRWKKGQPNFGPNLRDDVGSSSNPACFVPRLGNLQATQFVSTNLSYPAVDCAGDRETSGRLAQDVEALVPENWNKICEEGRLDEAFQVLDLIAQQGYYVSIDILYRLLKGCIAKKDLVVGRQVHALAVKLGHELNVYLASHIIRMYACHGCLQEASQVFSRLLAPDKFVWASIISAYCEHAPEQGIKLYQKMRKSGALPDDYMFVAVLKACATTADLTSGKLVHADVLDSKFAANAYVTCSLVDMYAKCGNLEDACTVFDALSTRNVPTWNAMIKAYCQHKQGQQALNLYGKMHQVGVQPDNRTFVGILKACSDTGAIQEGKKIHAEILERGLESDGFIGNTLVNMYAKCGKLEDARTVFDRLLSRDLVTWNAMVTGYANHGLIEEAVNLYGSMQQVGIAPDKVTFVSMLKACSCGGDIQRGRLIHGHIVETGHEADLSVGNTLIDMYGKCGSLEDARKVFQSLPTRDVVTWNAMIEGYAQQGLGQEALGLYERMQLDGVTPDKVTFLSVLEVCGSLRDMQKAKKIHEHILEKCLEGDVCVGSSLVNTYAKCGSLEDARMVFDRLPTRDVVTWSTMIAGYALKGLGEEALDLYDRMGEDGVDPDRITFISALKACSSSGAISRGRHVESRIMERRLENDAQVASSLIDMHAKCGSLLDARTIFDRLPTRDVGTWNAIIGAYSQHGLVDEALKLWESMHMDSTVIANIVTYIYILKACGSIGAMQECTNIHEEILKRGLESDITVGNSVLDMYVTCKSLEAARTVFDRLPSKNMHSWNTMIAGYAQNGQGHEALNLYKSMLQDGIIPDKCAFVSVLKACAHVKSLREGKEIHSQILEQGLEADVCVGNSLLDMYIKLGTLEDARAVFVSLPTRDVITWNTMVAGFAQSGLDQEAMDLFHCMQQAGVIPDKVSFTSILKACAGMGALQKGKQVHAQIVEMGLEVDVRVGNTLVDMYAKCQSLEDAGTVFDRLPNKNVITWTAMIAGYAQNGQGHEALRSYDKMQLECMEPASSVTFMFLLKACASTAAIQQGKRIHDQIIERGLEGDVSVGNTLVDMYAKCGDLENALAVFNKLPTRDVVSWNALINGYGQHNQCQAAMQRFEEMLQHGVDPNGSTFLSLIVACSHAGLVKEGEHYFQMMSEEQCIKPTMEHYCCMVDLLARSGNLDKAERMLQTMPFEHNIVGWMALLSACKSHDDVERGRRCFDHLVRLEPQHSAAYMLMSSIYANASRWADLDSLEKLRKSAGAVKRPAQTWIEVKDKVHEFVVGHDRNDTSAKLKSLNQMLKDEGHVPHTELVLKATFEQDKENALCSHAEKLAVAFGLLNTPEGTTLRVIKNMRMCDDCHSGTKIVSRVERREIIIRDQHRVHHFKDGVCSCGDSY